MQAVRLYYWTYTWDNEAHVAFFPTRGENEAAAEKLYNEKMQVPGWEKRLCGYPGLFESFTFDLLPATVKAIYTLDQEGLVTFYPDEKSAAASGLKPRTVELDFKEEHAVKFPKATPAPWPNKKPLSAAKAFNEASIKRQPALWFEKNNDMRGIGTRWKIPHGMTATEYERAASERIHVTLPTGPGEEEADFWPTMKKTPASDFLINEWEGLVVLNPELQQIRLDKKNSEDIYNAIAGVASGFNADDINFYIEQTHIGRGWPYAQANKIPLHSEKLKRIDTVAYGPVHWVMSPKTAEKVEARLKRRGGYARKLELSQKLPINKIWP